MVVTDEVVDDTCKVDRPRELGLISVHIDTD